jgi:PAS domain S-box-containing protein
MTRTEMPERDRARTNIKRLEETSMSTGESPPTTADPALSSAAVAAAGDAIVTTDGHGWITSWNRAAELMLGISAEQAIGQSLALIIPEALRARHAACFRAAMSSGRLGHGGQPARVEAMTPGGDVMPLAITLGLLAGPDSGPAGAVAVRRADASLVPFGNP